MSLEKNFQSRSQLLQLVSVALFAVPYGELEADHSCSVVRFNILCGAHLHGLWCALGMLTGGSAGRDFGR